MVRGKPKPTDRNPAATTVEPPPILVWLKAVYRFHSFAYRDPRSAFSSTVGLPVVSPTAVLLGIASTLFSLGEEDKARSFLERVHLYQVLVDSPKGIIFFRTFHQIRRYETNKYQKTKGLNPRMGLTSIGQATREYGLPEGELAIYVGTPKEHEESVRLALRNREHLGTHDSLCSLVGDVETCDEPKDVLYRPMEGSFQTPNGSLTVVTLSRFKKDQALKPTVAKHWWMAGGDDTELVPYLIKGSFRGTTRGKIYTKG